MVLLIAVLQDQVMLQLERAQQIQNTRSYNGDFSLQDIYGWLVFTHHDWFCSETLFCAFIDLFSREIGTFPLSRLQHFIHPRGKVQQKKRKR